MSLYDQLHKLTDDVNKFLIDVTGKSLSDLNSQDLLGNKYNLALFGSGIAFVSSMLILLLIGLTYDCCSSHSDTKKTPMKKRMFSSRKKNYKERLELENKNKVNDISAEDNTTVTTFH